MAFHVRYITGLFITSALLLSSCKSDSDPSIIGNWICSEGYLVNCGEDTSAFDSTCNGFDVNFMEGGTYSTHVVTTQGAFTYTGTYLISGDYLLLNLETGKESANKIYLTEDQLEIVNEQGNGCQLIWIYIRG